MTLSELTQAAAAFTLVRGSFNWLIDNFNRVADWVSSLERVGSAAFARPAQSGKPPTREKTPIAAWSVTTPL
jgi:ABC-type uncharacterized transport system fused permease/ATPase subunit